MALSEPAEYGHPDFILLDEVSENAFMTNLKLRYEKGKVRCQSIIIEITAVKVDLMHVAIIATYQKIYAIVSWTLYMCIAH